MTAVFTDFDSSMASRIVVDSDAGHVDVTFRSTGSTYRFNLNDADISDIMSVLATRSKGRLLHQLLDIRNGVRVPDAVTNVAVPNVTPAKASVSKTANKMTTSKVTPSKVASSKTSLKTQVKNSSPKKKVATR
jgi:hypothetical protein